MRDKAICTMTIAISQFEFAISENKWLSWARTDLCPLIVFLPAISLSKLSFDRIKMDHHGISDPNVVEILMHLKFFVPLPERKHVEIEVKCDHESNRFFFFQGADIVDNTDMYSDEDPLCFFSRGRSL